MQAVRVIIAKVGDFVKRHRDMAWQGFVFALIAWSAYNVGVLGAQKGAEPAQDAALFQQRNSIVSQTTGPSTSSGQGTTKPAIDRSDQRVVTSKTSSSKKYHHAWCSSGQRIKPENQVWFPSAAAAQAAGYSLAGNCTE
jgi:hypothetical protein